MSSRLAVMIMVAASAGLVGAVKLECTNVDYYELNLHSPYFLPPEDPETPSKISFECTFSCECSRSPTDDKSKDLLPSYAALAELCEKEKEKLCQKGFLLFIPGKLQYLHTFDSSKGFSMKNDPRIIDRRETKNYLQDIIDEFKKENPQQKWYQKSNKLI